MEPQESRDAYEVFLERDRAGSRMTSFPPMTCQKPARWGIPRYGSVPRSRSERLLGLLFMTDACHRRRKELPFPQSRPTTVPRPAPPAWVHPNSSREGSALGAGSHAFEQAGSHTSENRQCDVLGGTWRSM